MGNYTGKIIWGVSDDGEDVPMASPPSPFSDLVIPITLEDGAVQPEFKTSAAAGMDLCAIQDVQLEYGIPTKVETGVSMALPFLLYGQVQGRSSMAVKGISTFPGVIDSDYRGSIKILLTNQSPDKRLYSIAAGDRIAQLLVLPVARPMLDVVPKLEMTARGDGGFGSTNADAPDRV